MGRRPKVLSLTTDQVCEAMKRLSCNGDFEVWYNLALRERKIIEEMGKKTRDPLYWYGLEMADKMLSIVPKFAQTIERKVQDPTEGE